MNKEQKDQTGITNLDDVILAARLGIPSDTCERIRLRALDMAVDQHSISVHKPEDSDALIGAMDSNNLAALKDMGFSPWSPFRNSNLNDLAGYIRTTAFSIEESLLWAYRLAEQDRKPSHPAS